MKSLVNHGENGINNYLEEIKNTELKTEVNVVPIERILMPPYLFLVKWSQRSDIICNLFIFPTLEVRQQSLKGHLSQKR